MLTFLRGVLPITALALLLLVAGSGCGGGGGGNNGAKPFDVTADGQVVLGFLGGATVQVFGYDDFSTPLANTTTSNGATLAEIGAFSLPLQGIRPSDLFLFVVAGGQAFDADGDGVLDASPTANLGTAHCVVSGAQLLAGVFLVSIVSEVIYQRARYFMGALYSQAYLSVALNAWTTFVLGTSVDGDADVDGDDAVVFDPRTDQASLIRPYEGFRGVVEDLVNGNPVTDPAIRLSEPEISFVNLTSTVGIDVVGTVAYVAGGNEGLLIYDITNPAAPSHLGTHNTPGFARQVRVVGTLAYVADDSGGLQIVNVSNPLLPTMAGAVATPGPARDVRVQGTRAYVADDDFTTPMIHVIDVTTAATASILGSESVTGADAIEISGTTAYVAGDGVLEAFNVSVPSTPTSLGTVPMNDNFVRLAVSGTSLFSNGNAGLEVFDISTPGSPSVDALLELPGGSGGGLVVFDGRVVIGRSFDGLAIVDVQNPSDPRQVGTFSVSGGASHVALGNGVIVTTEVNGGLHVLAKGTPPPDASIATLDVNRQVRAVGTNGTFAVIGAEAAGGIRDVIVVDVSNPTNPVQRGTVAVSGRPTDILIRGNLAFVAHGAGLEVVDISNPDSPFIAGGDATVTGLQGLAIDTNVLYAGAGGRGLEVIDITTPTMPSSITTIDPGGTARGVGYDGSVVALSVGFPGIVTFDASTPTAPIAEGTFDTVGAVDVVTTPGVAFIADFSGNGITGGLHVVNISNAMAPTSITSIQLVGNPEGIALGGNHVFLRTTNALEVVDVTVPSMAARVATLPVFARAELQDVAAGGGFVYVGAREDGLKVVPQVQRSVP